MLGLARAVQQHGGVERGHKDPFIVCRWHWRSTDGAPASHVRLHMKIQKEHCSAKTDFDNISTESGLELTQEHMFEKFLGIKFIMLEDGRIDCT